MQTSKIKLKISNKVYIKNKLKINNYHEQWWAVGNVSKLKFWTVKMDQGRIFSKMKKELYNSLSILRCQSFGVIFSSTRILHSWCHPFLPVVLQQGCKLVLTDAEIYRTNNINDLTHICQSPTPPKQSGWGVGYNKTIQLFYTGPNTHSQSF